MDIVMVNLNGVDLPSPSVYRVGRQDLDSEDSGRNELGVLTRDRLREGVLKIELEYWAIDNSDATLILQALTSTEMNVEFLLEGHRVTRKMYVSDRNSELVRFMNREDKMAWNINFNLIEY
ncbi:MAG TPA: DUF6711 family protein [Tissierellaceae bacterium]|nr:DUF6711 family protein [Tissierellaceae bacterium]